MNVYAAKRWLLPVVAGSGLAAQAPATVWYSSFDPWNSATPMTSRVDAAGNPMLLKFFNTFNLTGWRNLSVVHFYAPQVAPMYWVELRIGGTNSGIVFRRMEAAPLQVRSHPIFPNLITIALPNTPLNPGTWSISVATDSRFSNGPAFYTPDFCPGWTLFFNPGSGRVESRESSGLMIQLADSL